MIAFPQLPGIDINIFLLIFIGLGVGILSGFAGVGGGFFMTPALIILGFPAHFAVGTTLTWIVGNSVVGAFRHRRLGNVDMRLGLVIILAAMSGMEVGVRILNWTRSMGLANEVVLSISIFMLLLVGGYTLLEASTRKRLLDKMLAKKERLPPAMRATSLSQMLQSINLPPMLRFPKSQITISLWIILAVGFSIGVLAGIIGVGGGFIMVPALVYLIGLPSFMAAGTNLFQVIFSAAYGALRHTMSGNVIIFAAFIMVVASSIGVQFGALVTRYVRGVSARYILGISIVIIAIGAILKLLDILLRDVTAWPEVGASAVTFGGMGLIVVMILALFVTALRYRRGQHIPSWAESLVSKTTE